MHICFYYYFYKSISVDAVIELDLHFPAKFLTRIRLKRRVRLQGRASAFPHNLTLSGRMTRYARGLRVAREGKSEKETGVEDNGETSKRIRRAREADR